MADILTLNQLNKSFKSKRLPRYSYFNRSELSLLLNNYSRYVITGEWRDYAIDHCDGCAIFSVFRHTLERPAFSIVKSVERPGKDVDYAIYSGRRRLKRSASLVDVLRYFDKKCGW